MSSEFVYHCKFFGCMREIVKQKPYGNPPKYCELHKKEVRRLRAKMLKRTKRNSMVGRVCHLCKGKVIKPHKKMFCSDYCAWLAELSQRSNRISRQLREFRLTKMLKVVDRQVEGEIIAQ